MSLCDDFQRNKKERRRLKQKDKEIKVMTELYYTFLQEKILNYMIHNQHSFLN